LIDGVQRGLLHGGVGFLGEEGYQPGYGEFGVGCGEGCAA
jgi:hypothetical protein